jgi:hypothetical protein
VGVFKGDEGPVMYLRKSRISVLPYLDDFFFSKKGEQACLRLYLRVRKDFFSAGLNINVPKCWLTPALVLRKLGFDVDMAEGKFRFHVDHWEALQPLADSILSARGGRVQARKLARLAGTVISMRLAWSPVTQLYSRYIYVIVHSMPYLNCWLVLSEKARSELLFR